MNRYGYHGKLLWIDLGRRSARWEERDEVFWRESIGGSLLATRLLLEHTAPGIDPLGPDNLLVFASSVTAGHPAPGLPRFTVSGKSPLTNGIGETRAEGPWGIALKASGADAIIFAGQSPTPVTVAITDGRVEFLDATRLWGQTVGATTDRLEQELGAGCHVAAIGPAGEHRVRFASIVTDRTFQAWRMGLGAVMGAKRLKAVVLRGGSTPPVADPAKIAALTESFQRRLPANALSRWQLDPPGFSCWLYLHGLDAALCVNNYSRATLPGLEAYKPENFMPRYRGHGACPGCPNDCIKVIHPLGADDLDPRASGIHQEVTGTMGANLGIADLDWVLRANNYVNQMGLDPVSLGFTLSFAMELTESGRRDFGVRFGDQTGAWRLMEDITHRRGAGDLLADGTRRAARQIGHGAARYAMEVKGLEMVCFEPRSQTNLALGYATAPIGPRYDICEHDWDFDTQFGWDHTLEFSRTLGILERIGMNDLARAKVRNFKALNTLWSGADALDLCIFAIAPTRLLSLPMMAELTAAVTGWQISDHEIMRIGERRNHLLRWYNLREGLTASEDTLPDRFFDEPISAGPRQGERLDRAQFQQNIQFYYAMMGWDPQGRPSAATLYDHRLDWLLSPATARPPTVS